MATTALAFLAGILSTLSPCVLPLLPIVVGSALSEHRAGPLALASGVGVVVRRDRSHRRDCRLCDRTRRRRVPHGRRRPADRDRHRAPYATAASTVRARRRPGRKLDRSALRRLFDRRARRPVRRRAPARRGLEPLCRADIGRGLGAGLARPGPRRGRRHHAGIWGRHGACRWCCSAWFRARRCCGGASACSRPASVASSHGRGARRDRAADRHRRRQGDRDRPRRGVTGVVE